MSALDRLLVGAAVAVSPAAHRDTRREQWLADVRDARELDLAPTALAFGALTTALFHRRAGHRSTWGESMTAAPLHVRVTPHTIPTIPVLVSLAVVSFLGASLGLGLLQRYNGFPASPQLALLVSLCLTVVPGTAVGLSVLLATGAPLRRRAMGALVVLAVSVLWWGIVTGFLALPVHPALALGIFAAAWLAVWLVVLHRPRWTWSLLLLPIVASALVFPLSNGVYGTQLAYSVKAALGTAVDAVPFLVAIVGAVVAARFSTDAPAPVEAHGEALVDKSA
ncbi:hypothetical protein ACRQ4B_08375 [Curtobacterium sp. SP.BCo]|uniref:hypothetical protein n=1 Tax=Curtobacterium sp. SP.BCo TaxID=3435229 RepID=UPI003F73EDF3